MNKYTVKGSYTVEATLIIPVVFFIIIGILYLAFYMHDKVRIQTVIDETALKGKGYIRNETDIWTGIVDYETYNNRGIFYPFTSNVLEKEKKIRDYLQNELRSGLFLARIKSIDISVTNSNIRIKVTAKMVIPFLQIKQLFNSSGLSVKLENSLEIHNSVEFIRIFSIFAAVAGKVEIINDMLKKLKSILSNIKS